MFFWWKVHKRTRGVTRLTKESIRRRGLVCPCLWHVDVTLKRCEIGAVLERMKNITGIRGGETSFLDWDLLVLAAWEQDDVVVLDN